MKTLIQGYSLSERQSKANSNCIFDWICPRLDPWCPGDTCSTECGPQCVGHCQVNTCPTILPSK